MRVVLARYAELQSSLRAKSRSKGSKTQPLSTRLTYPHCRAVRLAIFHSGRDFSRPPFPAFSRFSAFLRASSLRLAARKETVSTEPVMEEGFTRGRKRRRLRSRWVRSLSEIPFQSCKVSYLWRFIRRLVSSLSLSSSIASFPVVFFFPFAISLVLSLFAKLSIYCEVDAIMYKEINICWNICCREKEEKGNV